LFTGLVGWRTKSEYDRLGYAEAIYLRSDLVEPCEQFAFRRVSHLVSESVPVILENRVDQDGIDDEIENARKALSVEDVLALRGD
jgi:hypothetical protein